MTALVILSYQWLSISRVSLGSEYDVAVYPEITTNDMWRMIATACAEGGISFGMKETSRPFFATGQLVLSLRTIARLLRAFPNRRNSLQSRSLIRSI